MPYLSWKSFDYKGDAFSVFEAIKDRAVPFFLDSSLRKYGLGRYSFLGCEPFYVFKGQGPAALEELRRLLERYKLKIPKTDFPFFGGAVGYFSYDWGLSLEDIDSRGKTDLALPEVFFAFYDVVIAIDHLKNKLYVFSSGLPEKLRSLAEKKARERLRQVISSLRGVPRSGTTKQSPLGAKESIERTAKIAQKVITEGDFLERLLRFARNDSFKPPGLISNFTKDRYLQAVNKAKDYIRKGDIYQVNLSQRFFAQSRIGPDELYASLRRESPGGFSAYLDCGDFQILSSSPERFLCFDGKKVYTRPMKGTRPRGQDRQSDKRNKENLLQSSKDKAELLMIADLMRNDLGRVCEYGSVKVKALRNLEAYSTVYQTTATVEGVLHKDRDRIDLLKACFPGGSITGCPKIRSMRIIDELEPTRRGIYTGALGYLGFNGGMDLNILIRTILKKGDKIYFQAGGGIVADSQAESEYQETLVKAKGMFKAIGAR